LGIAIGGEPQEPLEIVLKSNGGAVSGMVSDTTRLHAFPHATVVLLPELPRRQNFALYQHVVTAENGRFSFTGIPPGDYKLFAWASLTAGAWGNALFLQRFESRGTPLTITEGTVQTVPLTVIP
jgi:hypothetical protein